MAPRYKKTMGKATWWGNAYLFNEDIDVQYELQWNSRTIQPGEELRFKHQKGKTFKFRCIAHNIKLDRTWIDCLDKDGRFRSFEIADLAGPLPRKRSRKEPK